MSGYDYIQKTHLHNKWWGGTCEWCSGTYFDKEIKMTSQEVHGFDPKSKVRNRMRCYTKAHTIEWYAIKHTVILVAVIIFAVGQFVGPSAETYYACEKIANSGEYLCSYVDEAEYNRSITEISNKIVLED